MLDPSTLDSLGEWDVGFDTDGSYPFYAPVRAGAWDRGLVAWHSCADPLAGPFVRRFYLDKQWLDCQAEDVGGPPLQDELGYRTMPAIAAFEDGRFLMAWNTEIQDGDGSLTRILLRFLR